MRLRFSKTLKTRWYLGMFLVTLNKSSLLYCSVKYTRIVVHSCTWVVAFVPFVEKVTAESKDFQGRWDCFYRIKMHAWSTEVELFFPWVTVEVFQVLMLTALPVRGPYPFSIGHAVCNPQSKQESRHHNVLMLHLFQGKQRDN